MEYVYAYTYNNNVKFGYTKDMEYRHRDLINGKKQAVKIIAKVAVEEDTAYDFYSRCIGTAFDKHLGKAVFDLTLEEVKKIFSLVQEQISNNCKKVLDKKWSERILSNNVGSESLSKLYNFFADSEIRNKRIKNAKQIPYNIIGDRKVLLAKAALEAKFPDKKFSYDEVFKLLQEEHKYSVK